MPISHIGQIALAVSDTDRAEAFYGTTLGLRKLYRYGDLVFFDCAGVRLMLSPPESGAPVEPGQGAIYFRVADLKLAVDDLAAKRVAIVSGPHLYRPDARPRPLDGIDPRPGRPPHRPDDGSAQGLCAGRLI